MKRNLSQNIFNVFNIMVMIVLCITMLYPYLNQLAIAFNEGGDTLRGGITIFPRIPTLDNFKIMFTNADFINSVYISIIRVVITVVLSLFIVYAAAFALTRPNLPYRRGITLFLMIPMYISAGIMPLYITYRYYHLINSFWVYILPCIFSFYNMVIIRSFLQEIPASIEESCKIDGANDIQIMIKIMFPISMPVVATVALWCAVGAWNDWTTTLMYVTDRELYTIQYLMMRLIKESEIAQQMSQQAAMEGKQFTQRTTSDAVKAAALIITTVPIIMVYPFVQKYFIKGVTLGAVKG